MVDLEKLKDEFPFMWKVQTSDAYKSTLVAYVDSRDVQDMLDRVVGSDKWQDRYEVIHGGLFCGISIKGGDEWVTKWDVGAPSNYEKSKGNSSDSFKRAAVKWGVGRFLYSLPIITLPSMAYKDKYYPSWNGRIIWDKDQLNTLANDFFKKGIYDATKSQPQQVQQTQQQPTKPAKPKLGNAAFDKFVARMNKGEDLYAQIDNHYSLTMAQDKVLKNIRDGK